MSPGNPPVEPSRFQHAFQLDVVAFATVFFPMQQTSHQSPSSPRVTAMQGSRSRSHRRSRSDHSRCSILGGTAASPLTPSRSAAEPATCQGCSLYRLRPQRFPEVQASVLEEAQPAFLLIPVTTPRLWSHPNVHVRLIFLYVSQLDCELPEGRSCVCNTTPSSELASSVSEEMFEG